MRVSTIRTISMYPEQWAVVEEVNERYRLGSISAALRLIISEWAKNQTENDAATEEREQEDER